MPQTTYEWRCCLISLRKRLSHLVISAAVILLLLIALKAPIATLVLGVILIVALHAGLICLQSLQRHRYDFTPR